MTQRAQATLVPAFEAQLRAVDGGSSESWPPIETDIVGRHSYSRLVISHLRPSKTDFSFDYDLAYAHAHSAKHLPEPQSLTRHLPLGTRFAYYGEFVSQTVIDAPPRVSLNLLNMHRPNGLTELAHEMGHACQLDFLGALIGSAISGDLSPKDLRFAAYEPAIIGLKRYLAAHPNFADDMSDPNPIILGHPESRFLNLDGISKTARQARAVEIKYQPADYFISSVLEADAWIRAFQFIRQGVIRPGMPRANVRSLALGAISSYDLQQSPTSTTHRQTLKHALHYHRQHMA